MKKLYAIFVLFAFIFFNLASAEKNLRYNESTGVVVPDTANLDLNPSGEVRVKGAKSNAFSDANLSDIGSNNTHRGLVTGNPHVVTKAEVSLGNVTNDEQVKKTSGSAIDLIELNFNDVVPLTIATGAVTASQTMHSIAGEGAASDDLVTINGGTQEDSLYIRPFSAAQDITIKNGTGNILTPDGADYLIGDNAIVHLVYDGANWRIISYIPSAAGEANTYSNSGAGGVAIILTKVGVDLPFKSINGAPSGKITVANDAGNSEVDIDADGGKILDGEIAGNGILARIGAESYINRLIVATANETSVNDGDGIAGNPTIGIADNPTLPGTSHFYPPGGTTAERTGPTFGMLRRNTDANDLEFYNGTSWVSCIAGAAGGEANTISNQGTAGVSVVASPAKAGVDLQLNSINEGDGSIDVALDGANKEIDLSVDISGRTEATAPLIDDEILVDQTTNKRMSIATLRMDINNDQTGTAYTFVIGDRGKTVYRNNAAASTQTIPTNASVAFPVGTTIVVVPEGAGVVTLSHSSVTVKGVGGVTLTSPTLDGVCQFIKRATDTWFLIGQYTD